MLESRESLRCLVVDTDSPNGDPREATMWVPTPVSHGPRSDASLQGLLVEAGMEPALAATVHAHACKRFLFCAARALGSFPTGRANELARQPSPPVPTAK